MSCSNAKIGEGGYAFATKSGTQIQSTIEYRRKLLTCPEHQHSDRHKPLIGSAPGDIKPAAPMATRKTSTPIPISQHQQWAKKILSLPEITNLRRKSAPVVMQEDINLSSVSSGRSNPPSPVQFVDYESIEVPHYIQLGATGDLISSKDVPKMRLIQPSFDLDTSNPPSRQSRSPSPSSHPSNRPPSARQQSNSPRGSPILQRWSPDSPRRSRTPPSPARQQSNSPRRSPIPQRRDPDSPRRSRTPPSPARQQSNSPRRSPIPQRRSPDSPRRPPQPPPRHHSPALSPRHMPRDATVPRTASSPKLGKIPPVRPPLPKYSHSDGNIKVHNSPPLSTSLPNGRSSSIETDFEMPDAWIGSSSITTLSKLNEEPTSQPTTEEAGYLTVISADQSEHKDGAIHSAGNAVVPSDTTSSQAIDDAIHRFSLTPINSLDDSEDDNITIDPYAILRERRESGDPYSILFYQDSISSRPPAPLPRNRTAQSEGPTSDKSEESEDEYEYVRRGE